MSDWLDDVFGPDGLLAGRVPGYHPRPGQIRFARAVDRALRRRGALLVEAPTGTGKTLGYGVPAVRLASRLPSDHAVVIATANKALQDQLANKDLPLLARVLPWPFRYTVLKGFRNYLCMHRFEQQWQRRCEGGGLLPDSGAEALRRIEAWLSETTDGDLGHLPFSLPADLRRELTLEQQECLPLALKGCPYAERHHRARWPYPCWPLRARDRAKEAQLVVCNHHILFQHLFRSADLLPRLRALILDEFHEAADVAREVLSDRLSQRSLVSLADSLGWLEARFRSRRWTRKAERVGRAAALLRRETDAFFAELTALARDQGYPFRLRRPGMVRFQGLREALELAGAAFMEDRLSALLVVPAEDLRDRCLELALVLKEVVTPGRGERVVYLEEEGGRGGVTLVSKPVEVAEWMRTLPALGAVVGTSATLTVGGSFRHLKTETGMQGAEELVVESPFDHRRQALLVVPRGLPSPERPEFPEAVARTVARVVELAGGRTLAIFTSYRNLEATHAHLRGRCPHRLLRQGELPRRVLVEEFRRDVRSVLLGVDSFRTGVDVPGEALSCLVIDRLPFPTPVDPLIAHLREHRPGSWFFQACLPRAVTAFRQAFGRLIRTAEDRGVVVVLDRRVLDRPYGRIFLKSLPPVRLSRDLEDVRRFLEAEPELTAACRAASGGWAPSGIRPGPGPV